MITETIQLRAENPDVKMCVCASQCRTPRPAMVILPGGGYGGLAPRENEPIVRAFLNAGFQTFSVLYSVGKHALYPNPLVDVSRAIVYIREHAEAYSVNPDRIFVVGFSAGGHLAGAIGTLWHKDYAKASETMVYGANRPTGVILSYPVISAGPYAHRGSFDRILGTMTPTEAENDAYSLELHVDERTVPAYIWHTGTDELVPVQNSLLYAMALSEHHIPYEMHIFPQGPHGLALANAETECGNEAFVCTEAQQWVSEAADWARRIP